MNHHSFPIPIDESKQDKISTPIYNDNLRSTMIEINKNNLLILNNLNTKLNIISENLDKVIKDNLTYNNELTTQIYNLESRLTELCSKILEKSERRTSTLERSSSNSSIRTTTTKYSPINKK